ncbi:putative UbiE/COQ5 family methyltransferase [Halenospora varia]|nr:putative UbiE/COQ5 family methyltransferase [Halenospora varia]
MPSAIPSITSLLAAKEEKQSSTTATDTAFAGPLWLNPDVGALYAKGERHTGPFSMPLLRMANLDTMPKKDSYNILDLCCGSGITTAELHALLKELSLHDKTSIMSADLSAGQLAYLDKRIKENGWTNNVTQQMNAQKTGQPSEAFDAITCAQGFMIIPDSMAALDECHRMLKPNGIFALSVWYQECWITHVRDALSHLRGLPYWPQTSGELTGAWAQGPWENPHYVEAMLHRHGFSDIKITTKSIHIPLNDADDFYEVYDAFIDWTMERFWTEEERRVCGPLVRPAVVKYMGEKFGVGKPFAIEKICMLATCKKV